MKQSRIILLVLILLFVMSGTGRAIEPEDLVQYPEYILHNGKIVTVDNPDFTRDLGTIGQAIAVRGDKVLAVGSNDEIRALAGSETKSIDLKGRTVLPGLIATHEHPADWAFISPTGYGRVVTDDEIVSRYLEGTPREQAALLRETIEEAVSKAKPGQWVRIYGTRGYFKEWAGELGREFPKVVSKSYLDSVAPDNPVIVRAGTGAIINTLALQKVLPKLFYLSDRDRAPIAELGIGGTDLQRYVDADSLMQGNIPLLAKIYKAELEYWASIGMTAFGSAFYSPAALRGYRYLDDRGEIPMRTGWAYLGPDFSEGTLETLAALQGTGTDYMWLAGAWPVDNGGSCTTINSASEAKRRESCNFSPPGSQDYKETGYGLMYALIKSGMRIATMHTGGDKDIDQYMDIIEKASAEAGITLEEIRAKRHAFDHLSLAPRPDQYERIKKLGMITSGTSIFHYSHSADVAREYGEEYTAWVVPRKSLSDAGIYNSFETDTPLGQHGGTLFEVAAFDLHRRDKNGVVHAPAERIDRERELKVLTAWGAYYLLKEKELGSLEPGKFADLIVLDRDYLTIPEEEVSKIQVMATLLGGKFVYAGREFAAENGMSPVGYQKP
jgi:predicted amidohydrolase YtcJ